MMISFLGYYDDIISERKNRTQCYKQKDGKNFSNYYINGFGILMIIDLNDFINVFNSI